MNKKKLRFLQGFIRESEWIEGIDRGLGEIKKELLSKQADGHVGAMFFLNWLAQKQRVLNKEYLCDVHRLIMRDRALTFEQTGNGPSGCYRERRVAIYQKTLMPVFLKKGKFNLIEELKLIRRAPHPKKVPKLMEEWFENVVKWQKISGNNSPKWNVRKIADFHFDFEMIHPFGDGNGRTGRAIAYYMLKFARLKPFIFWEYDKSKTYYPCFSDKTKMLMKEYFRIRVFEPKKIMGRVETLTEEDLI
ncbi:MAG: Fic family protein [Patescibacteria group bacterium]